MSESTEMLVDWGGPYLKIAAFCEKVLFEQDGTPSLIRVIDRYTQIAAGPGAPEEMPQLTFAAFLVLSWAAGNARGANEVTLRVLRPNGLVATIGTHTVQFEGEDRITNIIVQTNLVFRNQGLYWFLIELEGRLITKLPLRVLYVRSVSGSGDQALSSL